MVFAEAATAASAARPPGGYPHAALSPQPALIVGQWASAAAQPSASPLPSPRMAEDGEGYFDEDDVWHASPRAADAPVAVPAPSLAAPDASSELEAEDEPQQQEEEEAEGGGGYFDEDDVWHDDVPGPSVAAAPSVAAPPFEPEPDPEPQTAQISEPEPEPEAEPEAELSLTPAASGTAAAAEEEVERKRAALLSDSPDGSRERTAKLALISTLEEWLQEEVGIGGSEQVHGLLSMSLPLRVLVKTGLGRARVLTRGACVCFDTWQRYFDPADMIQFAWCEHATEIPTLFSNQNFRDLPNHAQDNPIQQKETIGSIRRAGAGSLSTCRRTRSIRAMWPRRLRCLPLPACFLVRQKPCGKCAAVVLLKCPAQRQNLGCLRFDLHSADLVCTFVCAGCQAQYDLTAG
eukprot:COSAG06_NODE_7209_length_2584_cov_4.609256_1_plen_405_part_00